MKWRVIIADESVIIHRTIEHILTGMAYELHFYQDGIRALQAVRDMQPEYVFAGIEELKGIDGYTLCDLVKNDEDTKNAKVFLLVPEDDEGDKEKINKSGADGYIVKPFEEEVFLHTIQSCITTDDTISALEKRLKRAEEKLEINRKELVKKVLYEAIPEIEKFITGELRDSFQKTVEEKIPYAIEKIVTERLEKRKEEL
jgi:CheY-like chemotaxis protein